MAVTVNIPTYLQTYTGNKGNVEVKGSTVGECLINLVQQFPEVQKMLFTRSDRLHSYIGIFVNGQDAYPDDLAKAVKDGDTIHVLYIIGGG